MLLKLRALGLMHLFVGVRVGEVYECTRTIDGRQVHIWGWNYRTLEGHVEAGQMDWEVWKWLDSGVVEFRVHSVSRTARIANPLVWVGYRLLRGRERRAFLQSTGRRMRALTDMVLDQGSNATAIRDLAATLTARTAPVDDAVPDALARNLRSDFAPKSGAPSER